MTIDLLRLAGGLVTLAAAIGAIIAGVRWANARWRRVSDFLDDWNGEPARPGFSGRPGVPERLTIVELSIATIRAEVTPNHGGSMKDTVGQINQRTRKTSGSLRHHLDWHANRGEVDPTARVMLTRPQESQERN